MVTVRIPNVLRIYADLKEFVNVDAATVDEALRRLVSVHPDLAIRIFDDTDNLHPHLTVYCDGVAVPRDDWDSTKVASSDQITVLIAISGGAEDVRMRGFRERSTVEATLEAALTGVWRSPPRRSP